MVFLIRKEVGPPAEVWGENGWEDGPGVWRQAQTTDGKQPHTHHVRGSQHIHPCPITPTIRFRSDTSAAFTGKRTSKQHSFSDIFPSHTNRALSREALRPIVPPLISTLPATTRAGCSISANALAKPGQVPSWYSQGAHRTPRGGKCCGRGSVNPRVRACSMYML